MLELRSSCFVSMAWDDQSEEPEPVTHQFDGIWDTGATGTLISANVVERCDLKQTGVATIYTANGDEDTVPTYLINLGLPSQVVIVGLPVALGSFGDADVPDRDGRHHQGRLRGQQLGREDFVLISRSLPGRDRLRQGRGTFQAKAALPSVEPAPSQPHPAPALPRLRGSS